MTNEERELQILILYILNRTEHALSADEISQIIINENLYSFSPNSPTTQSGLNKYIVYYLDIASYVDPYYVRKVKDEKYIYTPFENLAENLAIAIRHTHFKQYNTPEEIMENVPDSDINLQIWVALSLVVDSYIDLEHMISSPYANLRYIAYRTAFNEAKNRIEKDNIIQKALSENNVKIIDIAVTQASSKSNNNVKQLLLSLIGNPELSEIAYSDLGTNGEIEFYLKFLDLTLSNDPYLEKMGAINIYLKHYINGLPALFKLFINWNKYQNTFSNFGVSKQMIIDKILGLGNLYQKIPKKVKKILIDYCKSGNPEIQGIAMRCLKNKWTVKDLNTLKNIRCYGTWAKITKLTELVRLEASSALKLAKKYRNDSDQFVKEEAIKALGEVGGINEKRWLEKMFHKEAFSTGPVKYIKILGNAIIRINERLK